ncbi:BON domain-containing protein [Pyxidicoccus sp. MSG2]|uniref:BON domain-containing protein n=1 Tax=Pyxidicoccus sp. MSG2 TaxID=2996790 RepID=UPI00226F5FB7|nr:BON domain-containing protein [Pyxidicoccus sp. MSG2]MCY1022245.1 BON domain-containing protein [Pyxidicoccus sp. MSG2]
MSSRRDDDRGRRFGERELRRGQAEEYQAGRRGEYERDRQRDWDEHGYERGPERMGVSDREVRSMAENVRRSFRREVPEQDRDLRRADPEEETDSVHPSRDFEWDRDFRTMEGDRERRDYEMDRDFGRAARELDRAREYGRDFNRDREMDRRARGFDPERIARRPGYSPSGTFRAVPEEGDEERERLRRYDLGGGREAQRRGGPPDRGGQVRGRADIYARDAYDRRGEDTRRGRARDLGFDPTERIVESDIRYGGTQPAGHGPGVENMAPPLVGFSTSRSRREDHDLGHGGFIGGGYRPAMPPRTGPAPRNYQRADDRIRADLCDRLMMESWLDASDVEVKVEDGVVTLAGAVRSRDEKRAIEDSAEQVLGVKEVINTIRLYRAEGVMRQSPSREPVQPPGVDAADDDALHS